MPSKLIGAIMYFENRSPMTLFGMWSSGPSTRSWNRMFGPTNFPICTYAPCENICGWGWKSRAAPIFGWPSTISSSFWKICPMVMSSSSSESIPLLRAIRMKSK